MLSLSLIVFFHLCNLFLRSAMDFLLLLGSLKFLIKKTILLVLQYCSRKIVLCCGGRLYIIFYSGIIVAILELLAWTRSIILRLLLFLIQGICSMWTISFSSGSSTTNQLYYVVYSYHHSHIRCRFLTLKISQISSICCFHKRLD